MTKFNLQIEKLLNPKLMKFLSTISFLIILGCQNFSERDLQNWINNTETLRAQGIDFICYGKNPDFLLSIDYDEGKGKFYTKNDTAEIDIFTLSILPDTCLSGWCYLTEFYQAGKQMTGKGKYLNNEYEVLGKWDFIEPATSGFLQLMTPGKLIGNDGCNQFFGYYEQDNSQIDFTTISSTRKLCGENPNIISILEACDSLSLSNHQLKFYRQRITQLALTRNAE